MVDIMIKILASLFILGLGLIIGDLVIADTEMIPQESLDRVITPDKLFKGSLVVSETIRIVTAYNAGDPRQTDDTPCISANGENLCKALAAGKKRCAANFVPLGSRLHVDKVGVCLVTDRTHKRYSNRVDIAMNRHEHHKARQFGRQKLKVKILEPAPAKKYPASKL